MPDGSQPYLIKQKWEPWIVECIELFLDSHGAFRRYRYDMAIAEYPDVDISIYRVIRAKYTELMNAEMKAETQKAWKRG